MKRMFLTAAALGVFGLLISALGMVVIARVWSSFSDNWLTAAGFLPLLGVILGAALGRRAPTPAPRGAARLLFVLLAFFLSTLSAHLAFVITVSTWYANQPAVAQAGFLSLFFHPSHLPGLAAISSHSGVQSETTALDNLVSSAAASLVLSFLGFWWLGRRRLPD